MAEKSMSVDRMEYIISVFGSFDENLRIIENELNVRIADRDSELKISGDDESIMYAERAINGLLTLAAKGEPIDARNVSYIISLVKRGQDDKISELAKDVGFLPGDLQSKVDPYLRPLYDALFEMLGAETYNKYLERGNIEVAPLAYMRGRTLDDSFIILDEAQNTSREQMKMFLTRLGFGSKVVITGDITQIDLPADKQSGLKEAMRVLNGVEDVSICRLTGSDVVRHVLVQRIIDAYERYENRNSETQQKQRGGVRK